MRAKALLLGLDDALAAELRKTLADGSHSVSAWPLDDPVAAASHVERGDFDVVFCGEERERFVPLLAALSGRKCTVPVVVASRVPNTARWLDALDAGAWDYCGAPFEPRLLRHILENALKYPRLCGAGSQPAAPSLVPAHVPA
jgi:DNA-binding NtrC family response regulator